MKLLYEQIFEHKEAAALPDALESGQLPALISGLSAVHRANLAAALRMKTGRPLFIICPEDTAAENMANDLRVMLQEPVQTIGMREFVFYPSEAVSRQQEQKRLAAFYRLAKGESPVTVCSVSGLIQRTIPKETLLDAAFTVSTAKSCDPEKLERTLLRCGYSRTDQVEGPGQYSRRGGILDFFSVYEHEPVRIEFWGDEIDSMGYFDLTTQRRSDSIDTVTILPAAETIAALAPGGNAALAEQLQEAAVRYARKRSSQNAALVAATLRADAEKLRQGLQMSDADRYLPIIYRADTAIGYIPDDAILIFDQPNRSSDLIREYNQQLSDDVNQLNRTGASAMSPDAYALSLEETRKALSEFPVYMTEAFTVGRSFLPPKYLTSIPAKQLPSYAGNANAAIEDVKHYLKQSFRVVILAGDERRAKMLQEYFREASLPVLIRTTLRELPQPGECCICVGSVSAGMEYPELKLAVLTDAQLQRAKSRKEGKKRKLPPNMQRIESCADLSFGDYVVHENHGIGKFAGIVRMKVDGFDKDYIKIQYAGTDCLYVPATSLDLVTKYTGAGEEKPVKLSKMGGTEWAKTRTKAKGAAKEMAKKLITIYAARQRLPGHAFAPDSPWQRDFEESFGYTETDDQLRSIAEIKADMESKVPMDRLLCGDVGFGKTEVALRAVMKCILDGKQAALLCPTTVLAQQHYQTALQRFFGFPINISVLSRFKTAGQSNTVLRDLETGKCDFLIGTHRILSKDIHFKNLGLLVVDEEQRFGVTHKEHIKEMTQGVDVLTLSATPIPRTLNMALSGIRDMSTLDEPPEDRLPVQTFVMEHDWGILSDAIRRELQRGGQVYYLHNRVDDIERTAKRIRDMLGDVTVAVAHGQMDKRMLAGVMESVASGETQILVCTTIIETGIDIPNVNTLIIEDADRLGLAQLHQIRGRVGRSTRRASAYLTFKRDKVLNEDAEKRLNAIRDFAQFGSGYKIAMRDLEIRGAGNLLGAEQSGHLIDVGYDMYMKLLNEAVLEERGIKVPEKADCSADLAVAANIPDQYIPSSEQRMDIYRRIALIRTEEEADDLMDELIDRFGEPPPGVSALLQVALLRGEAGAAGIVDITQKQGYLRMQLREFDMEKVSILYSRSEYKNRIRVDAGSTPCILLKIKSKMHVIDEARSFVSDWSKAKDPAQA